jgi:hypothetical protein
MFKFKPDNQFVELYQSVVKLGAQYKVSHFEHILVYLVSNTEISNVF